MRMFRFPEQFSLLTISDFFLKTVLVWILISAISLNLQRFHLILMIKSKSFVFYKESNNYEILLTYIY